MNVDMTLTALADPTRRAILDRLRHGPMPVGRIAEGLPVSRPAVSQHLRLMRDAGLVSATSRGTRNLYQIAPEGAGPLVSWLQELRRTAYAVKARVPSGPGRRLETRLAPEEAWRLFCDDLSGWWPVAQLSLSARGAGALPRSVMLDARAGGALREVLHDGSIGEWARVREALRPRRLVLDWSLGRPEPVRVALAIAPERDGSRLTLDAPAGELVWDAVLERFGAAAQSSLSNF